MVEVVKFQYGMTLNFKELWSNVISKTDVKAKVGSLYRKFDEGSTNCN